MILKNLLSVVFALVFGLISTHVVAQSYDHSLKAKDMEFHWKVDGQNIQIKISGKTKGWVGIGFNPENKMKGANFIVGYVKGGKVKISDDFGTRTTGHTSDEKRGGKDSILNSSGSEKGGITTLEFTIPLNSGDKTDTVIDPAGKTIVLLARGKRDSFRIGHDFHATLEVNLNSGSHKQL